MRSLIVSLLLAMLLAIAHSASTVTLRPPFDPGERGVEAAKKRAYRDAKIAWEKFSAAREAQQQMAAMENAAAGGARTCGMAAMGERERSEL